MKRGAVEPPGLKWWQVLLDLAGSFSALGVGLYFSICERGETLDGSFLDQLSAEMAQKKKSQLPRAFRSKNKLFPLPQVWFVDFSQFGKNASVSSVLHDLEFVKANAVACWASLGVLFCNQLANEGFMFGQGKPTAPQRDLLRAVEMSVQRLMNDDTTVAWTEADIVDDFEHRTVTYSGEEICKAEPLTLARVLPGELIHLSLNRLQHGVGRHQIHNKTQDSFTRGKPFGLRHAKQSTQDLFASKPEHLVLIYPGANTSPDQFNSNAFALTFANMHLSLQLGQLLAHFSH